MRRKTQFILLVDANQFAKVYKQKQAATFYWRDFFILMLFWFCCTLLNNAFTVNSVTGLLCSRWQYWFHWWSKLISPLHHNGIKTLEAVGCCHQCGDGPDLYPRQVPPINKAIYQMWGLLTQTLPQTRLTLSWPRWRMKHRFLDWPFIFKTRSFRSLHLWICWIWISICSSGWYFPSPQPDSLLMYVYAAVYDFVLTLFRI